MPLLTLPDEEKFAITVGVVACDSGSVSSVVGRSRMFYEKKLINFLSNHQHLLQKKTRLIFLNINTETKNNH